MSLIQRSKTLQRLVAGESPLAVRFHVLVEHPSEERPEERPIMPIKIRPLLEQSFTGHIAPPIFNYPPEVLHQYTSDSDDVERAEFVLDTEFPLEDPKTPTLPGANVPIIWLIYRNGGL